MTQIDESEGRTAMDISMETPQPIADPAAKSRAAATWAGTIATWVLMAAATVVVLGLAAITIGPKFLPYQALVVRSGSMEPTIPTGSVVFYRKTQAADVKVGDVIVFAKPGDATEKVTHRVFQVGSAPAGRYFVTKGDANGAPDNWHVPAVGSGWIAAGHVPVLGYVLADLQSQTGRLLLLLIPAILLGAITLYELVADRRGPKRA
jgi:signal peptidase